MLLPISLVSAFLIMALAPYALRDRALARRAPPLFVFQACWVESHNVLLKAKRWRHLNAESAHDIPLIWLWISRFVSLCSLLSPMAYEVVDDFEFRGQRTPLWLINAYEWHFRVPRWLGGGLCSRWSRWKMLRADKAAAVLGVKVVGKGGRTKDRELTNDAQWFADRLGDDRPRLMHGDTLTAAAVATFAQDILAGLGDTPVFLTGATSKIGRAVALALAHRGHTVHMYTNDPQRFRAIQDEAGVNGQRLVWASTFDQVPACRLVITGKAKDGDRLVPRLTAGSAILNFAVPDPLAAAMLDGKSVCHYDSGQLAYPRPVSTQQFGMRLALGQTYACHAWLLTCAALNRFEDELGPVDVSRCDEFWQLASDCELQLPAPSSFGRPVTVPVCGGGLPCRTVASPRSAITSAP